MPLGQDPDLDGYPEIRSRSGARPLAMIPTSGAQPLGGGAVPGVRKRRRERRRHLGARRRRRPSRASLQPVALWSSPLFLPFLVRGDALPASGSPEV
jgi:hypothetical protein